jgi:U3 small nucleolar RNA-associated protein 3
MAKKRKAPSRTTVTETTEGWNKKDGKLAAFNTFEDVADEQDEFHITRDKVMLDDGPDAKRRRKWEEDGTWIVHWVTRMY